MKVAPKPLNFNTPRLSDLTDDPILKRFFRNGEAGDSVLALPAPKPVAPAAREKELA